MYSALFNKIQALRLSCYVDIQYSLNVSLSWNILVIIVDLSEDAF